MTGWRWLAAGVAAVLVAEAAAGLAILETGAFDPRASTPHNAIVAWATHETMVHAMHKQARGVIPPRALTPAETIAGLHTYERDCISCHGGPGVPRGAWTQGINPSPPFLLDASRRWSPGELYWIVKHGVKMTAMPAWGPTESDGKIWDMVAFLEAMPEMRPADFQRLQRRAPPHR